MQTPISLKTAERKAFQTTFADGLWDVFIGCFILMFALAPLLSQSLGDFWSSFVFLPFWGLVYLAIWLARKHLVAPRLGSVTFGKARQQKMRSFNMVMIAINLLALALGILAFLTQGILPQAGFPSLLGLLLLVGFSVSAYLLEFPRLYLYGLLLFAAPLVGEWLYANYGAAHHGFPIVFGFCTAVMILVGLGIFIRLLVQNPLPQEMGD